MKKLNQKGFGVVEVVAIVVVITLIGFMGWYIWDRQNSNTANDASTSAGEQRDASTTTLAFQPIDTKDWKSGSEKIEGISAPVTYKHPAGWTTAEGYSDGHPNYLTLSDNTKKQCVKLSLSSEGNSNLDEALTSVLKNWNAGAPNPTIDSSVTFTTNKNAAKIAKVQNDNDTLYAAAVSLGKDERYPGNTFFALLTTCGVEEADIFNAVVKSIDNK